ncbi:MAG: hypothetical protein QM757_14805 [Paludibaculum sp.]
MPPEEAPNLIRPVPVVHGVSTLATPAGKVVVLEANTATGRHVVFLTTDQAGELGRMLTEVATGLVLPQLQL